MRHRADRFFSLLARGEGRRLASGWMTSRHVEESKALLLRLVGPQDRDPRHARPARGPERPRVAGPGPARRARFVLEAEDDSARLLRRDPRPRCLPEGDAHRRVRAARRSCSSRRCAAAVLTSATLAVDGGFDYLKVTPRHRRGGRAAAALALRLHASRPSSTCPGACPSRRRPTFVERAAEEVVRLLELSQGRAFVLFTSYANMNAVAERVAGRVEYPHPHPGRGAQGPAPRDLPHHPGCRALRHRVLLAGGRRGGGAALLRDHRQAALRLARRPGGGGAHRAAPPPGRQPLRRVPGAGGGAHAEAGPRPPHPLRQRPRHPRRARQPARREELRPPVPGQPAPLGSSTTWAKSPASSADPGPRPSSRLPGERPGGGPRRPVPRVRPVS